MKHPDMTRRTALRGVAGVAAGSALAACGSGSTGSAPSTAATSTSVSEADGIGGAVPSTADAAATGALGKTSDIAVGGGVIYQAAKVVVTQPTAGQYKCFTAVCTHQGCLVSKVESAKIICNCHNSEFSISDGSVLGGPATGPLAEQKISVSGDSVSLA